jgi:hypothetical protein
MSENDARKIFFFVMTPMIAFALLIVFSNYQQPSEDRKAQLHDEAVHRLAIEQAQQTARDDENNRAQALAKAIRLQRQADDDRELQIANMKVDLARKRSEMIREYGPGCSPSYPCPQN